MSRLATWLVARRLWLLAAALLLAGASLLAPPLPYDRSIENMFAPDDPLLPPYRRLAETFGGNEVVMLAYTDDDFIRFDAQGRVVAHEAGIERAREISRRARAVPGVRDTLSLAELADAINPLAWLSRPPLTELNELLAVFA